MADRDEEGRDVDEQLADKDDLASRLIDALEKSLEQTREGSSTAEHHPDPPGEAGTPAVVPDGREPVAPDLPRDGDAGSTPAPSTATLACVWCGESCPPDNRVLAHATCHRDELAAYKAAIASEHAKRKAIRYVLWTLGILPCTSNVFPCVEHPDEEPCRNCKARKELESVSG